MIYAPTLLFVTGPFPGYNQATIQCQEKIELRFIPATSIRWPRLSLSNAAVSIPLCSLNQLLAADFVTLSSVVYIIIVFATYHDEAGSLDLMALLPDSCSRLP
jgi:hypothetical protein